MFKHALTIARIRGIRIDIHASWLVIAVILVLGMTTGFLQQYPDWSVVTAALTALAAALVFFSSIVAHELGHSLTAIRRGVPVRSITLFIFGGVAELERDSERAEDEFWIALAGPAVSLVLAGLFGLLSWVLSGLPEPVSVALGWLALVNLVVALFNMIPGFPLDGGRVFRAIVWRLTGSARKGVDAAVLGGRLVAYGLFALALYNIVVVGNIGGGLWILLIAWFLLSMAQNQGRQFSLKQALQGVTAADLAEADPPRVASGTTLRDWVDHQVLPTARRAALVTDGQQTLGIISFSDTRQVDTAAWAETTVDQVMTGKDRWISVTGDTPADVVLQRMTAGQLNQLPVLAQERVVGWIERQHLLHAIELYTAVDARRPQNR